MNIILTDGYGFVDITNADDTTMVSVVRKCDEGWWIKTTLSDKAPEKQRESNP